jgi:WD40 repeat protein
MNSDGKLLQQHSTHPQYDKKNDILLSGSFSAERWIGVGTSEGEIAVWSSLTERPVWLHSRAHQFSVWTVEFLDNSSHLLASGIRTQIKHV